MNKSKVKYLFDVFAHLKSFDIIPYQKVIDLYNETELRIQSNLESEENDGTNTVPFNSDVDEKDDDGFWWGYPPKCHWIRNDDNTETVTKSDVVSMDMTGLNKTWDSFMYLEIPSIFFDKYQKSVHSNPNIEIYREFMKEIDKTDLRKESIDKVSAEFDIKYPTKISITNFFRTYEEFAWRIDLDERQYVNMKKNGIIYPICYNSTRSMLDRGTHRMLFLSSLGSAVPIFIQSPYKKYSNYVTIDDLSNKQWEMNLGDYFGEGRATMIIDKKNKKLQFYINNKLVETYG